MSEVEAAITKATSETLAADNWQYLMEVCDIINTNPEVNTKKAVQVLKSRLRLKDANVILRTLSLLLALGENCGSRMQQEIACTLFLKEGLLSKLGDKGLHRDLKLRIAEVIGQLDRSFENDPSLKAISDAYESVKKRYPMYLPNAPRVPAKNEMTSLEKEKEEQEIERAIRLSAQEYEREQSMKKIYLNSKPLPSPENQSVNDPFKANQLKEVPTQTDIAAKTISIANIRKVRALYDLISYEPDELSFKKGDIITVQTSVYRDWWRGSLANGNSGIFPLNYVTPIVTKSPEQLESEKRIENHLLAVNMKEIDQLLAMLSCSSSSLDENEITELYNRVIAIKPALANFIEKYGTRRDELKSINEQMSLEVSLYNQIIDNIIASRQRSDMQYSLPYPSSQGQNLYTQPTGTGFGNGPPEFSRRT